MIKKRVFTSNCCALAFSGSGAPEIARARLTKSAVCTKKICSRCSASVCAFASPNPSKSAANTSARAVLTLTALRCGGTGQLRLKFEYRQQALEIFDLHDIRLPLTRGRCPDQIAQIKFCLSVFHPAGEFCIFSRLCAYRVARAAQYIRQVRRGERHRPDAA